MIATLARKEFSERWLYYGLGLVIAGLVAASMPWWFNFSLHQAFIRPVNDVSAGVLLNFRSYPRFATAQWAGRTLPQILFLIALFAGSVAIVSERESRTLSFLCALGIPLRTIVLVKYAVVAAYIIIGAILTTAVILAASAIAGMNVPIASVLTASSLALLNAFAFLSVAFVGSALATRAPFAALYTLVIGFAFVGILYPLGVNGMAMPEGLYGVDGSFSYVHLVRSVTAALVITVGALVAAILITEERGAA